jgi:hypothetical protein
MNAEIRRLFADYLLDAKDPTAAAVLVLADVLRQEPVIEDCAAVAVLLGPLADVEPLLPCDLDEPEAEPIVDGETPRSALATTRPIVARVLAAVWLAAGHWIAGL